MHNILIILAIAFSSNSQAQLSYSEKIPVSELKHLKVLEKTLKKLPFTLPKRITDTAKLSGNDSIAYSKIFIQFFDTAQIQLLRTRQTNYLKLEEEPKWLQGMTISAVIGIHNVISCIPDSIFFVMPATEYNILDKDDDRVRYASNELLVAGYKGGGFYYPLISILFSKPKQKIIYINFLINFEGYPRKKEDYFNTNLEPLLSPCMRTFSEDFGSINYIPTDRPVPDTLTVVH